MALGHPAVALSRKRERGFCSLAPFTGRVGAEWSRAMKGKAVIIAAKGYTNRGLSFSASTPYFLIASLTTLGLIVPSSANAFNAAMVTK
jgi:hypothetical protein